MSDRSPQAVACHVTSHSAQGFQATHGVTGQLAAVLQSPSALTYTCPCLAETVTRFAFLVGCEERREFEDRDPNSLALSPSAQVPLSTATLYMASTSPPPTTIPSSLFALTTNATNRAPAVCVHISTNHAPTVTLARETPRRVLPLPITICSFLTATRPRVPSTELQ